jgi:two-component system LytT family response regulator
MCYWQIICKSFQKNKQMETPTSSYSCVIMDDDLISIDILKHYINRTGQLSLEASFTDPVEGMAAFRNGHEKIDFLFLDIEMEVSGFDVARMLRNRSRFIIFTSSNSAYMINSLSNGDSLLIKPFTFITLQEAVKHLIT